MNSNECVFTQNADLYKFPIRVMRWCGHAHIWDTKENLRSGRKAVYFTMKWWNFCLFLVQVTALPYFIVLLIERSRLGGIADTVGVAMLIVSEAFFLFSSFWIGKKADTIKTLMFIHEIEYAQRKNEYGFVKSFSLYAIILLQSSITVAFNLFTLLQFFKDEYVQHFYDSMFPSFHFNVSSCPVMFRMGAVSTTILLTFLQPFALQNAIGIFFVMFAFTKRHYDVMLSSAKYDRTQDLKKTRKLISDIESSLKNLNDVFSLPLLMITTTTILLFCIVVVYFFGGIDIQPGFESHSILVIFADYALGALLAGVTVLYYDRKSDRHVRRIYRISAMRNPRDTDFAIQAECLAKQIYSTKVTAKMWKFHHIDRLALLHTYSTIFSYVMIVAEMMPAAQEVISILDEELRK